MDAVIIINMLIVIEIYSWNTIKLTFQIYIFYFG